MNIKLTSSHNEVVSSYLVHGAALSKQQRIKTTGTVAATGSVLIWPVFPNRMYEKGQRSGSTDPPWNVTDLLLCN